MSDQEFENYLHLLRGLLRLSRDQSESISAELRSHMEDRLEELLARGISRDEAIQQALAEFGDAAGLGNKFGAISLSRKRRWLMRLMTFSTAATLLIAASLITFWPGRNAAPGVANLIAQAPPQLVQVPINVANMAPVPHEQTLDDKLNQRIDVDFSNCPLGDAISFIQEHTGIQFVVRQKKLEEASVSIDTPITKRLKSLRVITILRLLLEDLELTYVDRDDLILITTPEDAESTLQIRVYDGRDLLAMATPGTGSAPVTSIPPSAPMQTQNTAPGPSIQFPRSPPAPVTNAQSGSNFSLVPISPATESAPNPSVAPIPVPPSPVRSPQSQPSAATPTSGMAGWAGWERSAAPANRPEPVSEYARRTHEIIELVKASVAPDTWDDVGGPGSIGAYNGLIVVSQTAAVHQQVERLFDMLREAAGLEVPKTGKVIR